MSVTGEDGRDGRPPHPLVFVGGVMLALYDKRDPDQALRLLAAHFDSADPWTRSGARLMHAFTSMALGRLGADGGEHPRVLALAGLVDGDGQGSNLESRRTRQEGIEPPTCRFGDGCSTS